MNSFYIKYRPQLFSQVKGQEIAVKILSNSIKNNLINHAYLLYGIRGTGKTTLARIFAKSLNCSNRKQGEFEPCNNCDSCNEITNNRSLNVIEIDAASNNGVDEIRNIKENINQLTITNKYKIYIIDEVHMLSKAAFNALLKTLEEPPKNVIFILATTELNKIPDTVLSRVVKINLALINEKAILAMLKEICNQEGIKFELDALINIEMLTNGSLRDAISLLETVYLYNSDKITVESTLKNLGIISSKMIEQLLINHKYSELAAEIQSEQINPKHILQLIINLLTNEVINGDQSNLQLLNICLEVFTSIKEPKLIKLILITKLLNLGQNKELTMTNNDEQTINLIKLNDKTKNKYLNVDSPNDEIKQNTNIDEDKSIEELQNKQIKKTIDNFINKNNYLEILFQNNSHQTHNFSQSWLHLRDYSMEKEFKNFIPLLTKTIIIASNDEGIILGIKDEDKYQKIIATALEDQFLKFIEKVFGSKKIILPILEPIWKNLLNEYKELKNKQEIVHADFALQDLLLKTKSHEEVIDEEMEKLFQGKYEI